MNTFIILSIISAIYIVYILNYFKTRYSLAHPLTYFENKLFYHPIGVSEHPLNQICPFGHISSWFLSGFIILRIFLVLNKCFSIRLIRNISMLVLFLTILFSLMNFNALVYLIPYIIIEIYIIKKYFKL